MSSRLPTHPFVLLVAASAFWGVGTVLSKLALDRGIPPVTLLAVEMGASSSLLLLALLATTRFRPRIALTLDLGRLVALGALNPALGYALALLGLVTVSASLAVLVWAIEPVIVVLLAVPLLGERPERRTVALVLIAVAGAVLVLQGPGTSGQLGGIALTLAAVLACALYTVLTRRLLLDDGSLVVVLGQQLFAFVLVLVALVVGAVTGWYATSIPDGRGDPRAGRCVRRRLLRARVRLLRRRAAPGPCCGCGLGATADPRVGAGGRVPGRRPAFPRAVAGRRDRRACGPRRRADADQRVRSPRPRPAPIRSEVDRRSRRLRPGPSGRCRAGSPRLGRSSRRTRGGAVALHPVHEFLWTRRWALAREGRGGGVVAGGEVRGGSRCTR